MKKIRTIAKWTAVTLVSLMAVASFIPVAAQVYTSYAALDGSPGSPAFTFNSAQSTGLSRDAGSGGAQISAGGTLVQRWVAAGAQLAGQTRYIFSASPAINTCGTATVSGGSTDSAGSVVITAGTPSSCTVNFAATWAKAPFCYATSNRAASQGAVVTASTTVLTMVIATTFTGQAANWGTDTIQWHCESN